MSFGKIQCVNIDKIRVYPTQPEALDTDILNIEDVNQLPLIKGERIR